MHPRLNPAIAILGALLAGAPLVGQAPASANGGGGIGAPPQPLSAALDNMLAKPAAQRAFWGVHAVDLTTGATLLSHNSAKLFVPASNAKLFTTALALTRLGPEYQFRTVAVADSPIRADGVIAGPVTLVGGGDPNLSSRVLPYDKRRSFGEDRLAPMEELARQFVAAGVTRIEGDIVGDDSRYVWDPHPDGWTIDDSLWGYGAPVSALSFNDNLIDVLVRPGSPGAPARLTLRPALELLSIDNRTRTAPRRTVARRLTVRRGDDSPLELELYGQISSRSPGRRLSIAVPDPARYAAMALRQALVEAGIEVVGGARSEHLEPQDVPDLKQARKARVAASRPVLASIASPPLATIVQPLNKDSVNLHAEMLLREVGYAERGVGSVEAGIEAMREFLAESGLSRWEFFLEDASGLSRKNLVSPDGTVKLLRRMWQSSAREPFVDALAVSGVDGTLDWRFSKTAAKGRIRAKTGTLSHVTALSGYAETFTGETIAFSIYVNNFGVSSSYIRRLMDELLVALVSDG